MTADDHSHIWTSLQPTGNEKAGEYPNVIFYVQSAAKRTASTDATKDVERPKTMYLSLTDIVRKYTNGRFATVPSGYGGGGGSTAVLPVEMSQLYDILNMLRSLQYDIQLYNSTIVVDDDSKKNIDVNYIRYCRYRLQRQATACTTTRFVPGQNDQRIVVVEGLDALVQFIETTYADKIQSARDYIHQQGLIDFDAMSEYCVPGTVLVDGGLLSGVSSTLMCVKCRAGRYRRSKTAMGNIVSVYETSVEMIVAIGGQHQYAVIEAQWSQSQFDGTRSISAVSSGTDQSTILFQPTDKILQELQQRGHDYQSFCFSSGGGGGGASGILVDYHPETFWPCHAVAGSSTSSSGGAGRPSRSGGRMMVDPLEAWKRGIHPCKPPADGAAADAVLETFQSYARYRRQQQQSSSHPQSKAGGGGTDTAATSTSDAATTTQQQPQGPDDILLLVGSIPEELVAMTWPVVCGFSLVGRVWGVALVEGLSKIQFIKQAFDTLVLPPARKRLLRALVTSHYSGGTTHSITSSSSSDDSSPSMNADVLPGKGEGLIILLYGPPGVGKTLTAEAVSEVLERPLYRVSMGELGTIPERLEERLQEIFDLCLPWKALVLIDEAEMLLETRRNNNTDLVRNAMVCVMLRLLEYYPGILFLTTNSGVEELDPAVASRITCALHYTALTVEGRKEIWRTSLDRVMTMAVQTSSSVLSDDDLTLLATTYAGANGRQIKNAVQLASIVCRHEDRPLTMEALRETFEMTATTSLMITGTTTGSNNRAEL